MLVTPFDHHEVKLIFWRENQPTWLPKRCQMLYEKLYDTYKHNSIPKETVRLLIAYLIPGVWVCWNHIQILHIVQSHGWPKLLLFVFSVVLFIKITTVKIFSLVDLVECVEIYIYPYFLINKCSQLQCFQMPHNIAREVVNYSSLKPLSRYPST